MKTAQETLTYLANHPWLSKGFSKLNKEEVAILTKFLEESPTDRSEAMLAVNKMFLSYNGNLPKRWTTISEMASCGTTYRFQ